MSKIRTKADVEFHSDGRESYPAVNVKVYKSLNDVDFTYFEIPEGLTLEWIEEHVPEGHLDSLFWETCQNEWEMIEQDAEEIFGKGTRLEQQGRSGGWACVTNLPDIENWDAVMLAKWRKFARYARQIADGIPEQMVYSIGSNEYEIWKDEQAEEAGLHRDPVSI